MLVTHPRKVLGVPIDSSATSYHRVVQPLHFLMQEGAEIQFLGEQKDQPEQYQWADILYTQCLYAPDAYKFYHEQKLRGKRLIVDFDDDYLNIPIDSPEQTEIIDSKTGEVYRFPTQLRTLYVKMFIALADVVVVTTEVLKNLYAPYAKKVVVIPNCVSNEMLRDIPKYDNERIRILWTGSASHKPDLEEAYQKEFLQKINEKYGDKVEFHFQGPLDFESIFKELPMVMHPTVPYGDYLNLIQDINPDIAIAPLKLNEFNASKSNIKYLQMTLMEAAFVGQNYNPYIGIENGVDGYLVDNSESWARALSKLIESKDLRDELVTNAMKYVKSQFMIEKQIDKWRALISF